MAGAEAAVGVAGARVAGALVGRAVAATGDGRPVNVGLAVGAWLIATSGGGAAQATAIRATAPRQCRPRLPPGRPSIPDRSSPCRAIQGARTRQIRERRKHREEGRQDNRAEDEGCRVVDADGLERELTEPTPEEQELNDRKARH